MAHKSLGCHKSNIKDVALVRNVEVPLAKEKKWKITRDLEGISSEIMTARSKTTTSRPSARSIVPNTASSSQFVPSEMASTAREQLTKKLNFPIDDHIYRGLVPVNVNDSVIIRDCPPLNQRAMHKKYLQKMKNKKRDPEPDLNDFLTVIKPLPDAYPKYKIDTSVDVSLLPKLPRGNLDKVTEIILKLGVLD